MSEEVTMAIGEVAVWQKAVRSQRCAVCFALSQEEFKELADWVGLGLDDPGNRQRLDESDGVCNGHFWLLKELHSPQSGAVMNDEIAGRLLARLREPGAAEKLAGRRGLS